MPGIANRRVGGLALVVIVALFVSGCSDQTTNPAARPTPSTSTAASTTTAAAPPTAQRLMTGPELVWLDGISRLHKTMDKALTDSPSLTPETLRSLAQQLRSCAPELARLGPATERLQPVFELAEQGCTKYGEAATCFDTAASPGISIEGTDGAPKVEQAINCGSAAFGKASALFADAEVKGFEIKQAAG